MSKNLERGFMVVIDASVILVILSLMYQRGILQLENYYDLEYLIRRSDFSKVYAKLLNTNSAVTLCMAVKSGERLVISGGGHVLMIKVVDNDETKYEIGWIFPMEIKAVEYNVACNSSCPITIGLIIKGQCVEVTVRKYE